MTTAAAHRPHRSLAQSALERALRQTGAARAEQLAGLSRRYPDHGPIWLALAEQHISNRRREDARYAARKALELDAGLARTFSSPLAGVCEAFMPHRAAPAGTEMKARAMRRRIHNPGDPSIELAQAKRLGGHARADRLESLTERFPEHAPTWLAFAEELLAARKITRAMEALNRALTLDPEQQRFMSPRLETAHRYHDAEAPASSSAASQPASPAVAGTASPTDRTHYVAYAQIARSRRSPSRPVPAYMRAKRPARDAKPATGPVCDRRNLDKLLSHALDIPERSSRLAALRELAQLAPHHPEVLFHLAMQLVIAGEVEEARRVGRDLQRVDQVRYQRLYTWADEWTREAAPAASVRAAQEATVICRAPASPAHRAAPPARPAAQEHKTRLLALPMAGQHLAYPAPVANPLSRPIPSVAYRPARHSLSRRIRTAGALIAGVAAGVLVAMLLVFVVNTSSTLDGTEPAPQSSTRHEVAGTDRTDIDDVADIAPDRIGASGEAADSAADSAVATRRSH